MLRLLTYPANIGVALFIGIIFSLMPFSYFYETPDSFYILLLTSVCIFYIFISIFFKRDVYVDTGNDGSSWKIFMIISAVGFAIEFSVGGMPILVGRENAVTIPVFHVIFYSFIIMAVLLASVYGRKRDAALSLTYAIVMSALMLSRQMMIVSFIIVVVAVASKARFNKKNKLYLIASFVAVVVIFGILGNLRQQLSGDYVNDYIYRVGGANADGMRIGDTMYWLWLYIASPVYNLMQNLDSYYQYGDSCNMSIAYGSCEGSYLLSVIVPDTISKYFSEPFEIDMVMKHLNAGTAFSASARILGFAGILIQIVFQLMLYILGILLTTKRNRRAFVVYFSVLSFFIIFDNLFVKGEFFFVLLIIIASGRQLSLRRAT
ncbi:hypothetical protein [Enterobacter hormaechei]|uniref:hypothetical protein n=1 Tax=Enterobacter hormaechei TaxID=158836 RepID=UPI001E5D0B49|nr:hypothetical protein [Enterobacter hormaechei]MCC4570534.1 hypothetical protein [Enterobacter hormaechei subsp. hoffmannii]MCC4573356.1 hypothetical protein [Enterobacter hormaechei subsp. hoffmannii]MCC4577902.1 hypothetical protein [Enterobacter hormaechei subsp. hoffmannii]MCC4584170.1 hypothetical protein [Enterobacter hormaechei subsp. hoffmannii]